MRITFVSPSLRCGGAERCLTLLTRGLLKRGHPVAVITLYPEGDDFYELPPGAGRIALGINEDSPTAIHGLINNVSRLRALGSAIRSTEPEVVISHIHQTNVMTILAVGRASLPVVVVEHNEPGMSAGRRIWDRMRRLTYPHAQMLVSVSQGVNNHFDWLPETKRAVIHNPLEICESDPPDAGPEVTPQADRKSMVAMGRLTAQKGFDLLLAAFRRVTDLHPDWSLTVIGDGELRKELEAQRDELGLTNKVWFAGLLSNPIALLRNADLFVMASRYEGFPYAALEAMACGLPVIYTDCPSGPREIISDGIDGLLVPSGNLEALVAAMDRLMNDEPERKRLAAHAPAVLDRFGLEKTLDQWEELLAKIANDLPDRNGK